MASGQTVQETIRAAINEKPSLQAKKWDVQIAAAGLGHANLSYLPTISATSNLMVTTSKVEDNASNTSYPHTWLGITATLPLFDSGVAASTKTIAEYDFEIAKLSLSAEIQATVKDVIDAYMELYTSELIVGLNESNVERLQEQLRATEARSQAGVATRTDVNQAQASVASARAELAKAQGNQVAAQAAFKEKSGLEGHELTPFKLQSDVLPYSLDAAIELALSESSAISIADLQYRRFRALSVQTASGYGPKLNLSASSQLTNSSNANDDNVLVFSQNLSLNFSTSLYSPGASYVLNGARSTVNSSEASLYQTRASVHSSVVQAWVGVGAARARAKALEERVAAQAVATKGVEEEVRQGQKASIDGIEARFLELDARNQLTLAKRDEVIATVTLMYVTGRLTPDVLGL